MLQFLNYSAGRRHRRCLEKRGTFGTSRWQLYDEATLFPRSREGARFLLLGPAPNSCSAANGHWFDHQISGKPRRSPFPCILGRDRLPMKQVGRHDGSAL
jgi:hypothetical protein